jgi:DNA-binding transcriptional LysR family regulator
VKELDLLSLRYFAAVCDTGSITRAAAQEHIVPSAISKRLTQLELDLGVSLLDRERKGVRLTPAGETLMDHARAMLSSARHIKDDMAAYGAGVQGKVHLLASASVISEALPDDVAAFLKIPAHRQIKIDIEEEVSREIVRRIGDGTARVGVLWDGTDLSDLETVPYRTDHLVAVVHPDHPLAGRKRCAFVDTLEWEHVGLDPASAANQMQARAAAIAGKRIQYRAVVSNFESALRVVRANLGISIIPREIVETYLETFAIRVVPLSDAWAKRRFMICHRAKEPLPKAVALLVDYLRKAAAARG